MNNVTHYRVIDLTCDDAIRIVEPHHF